jgi:hypothetical protein
MCGCTATSQLWYSHKGASLQRGPPIIQEFGIFARRSFVDQVNKETVRPLLGPLRQEDGLITARLLVKHRDFCIHPAA